VNQPGSYRDVTDTTVVAQFKVLESSRTICSKFYDYISSKSTTLSSVLDLMRFISSLDNNPWTLPSNTALTVGPKSIMF
jgi:isoleucyl-tRNA synthetase